MSKFVLSDAYFSIGGTDLSDHVNEISIEHGVNEVPAPAMGDGTIPNLAGLKDWTVEVTFNQDFAASEVDATLWPLVGTDATIAIRPTSSAASATNPEYGASALVVAYNPFGQGVGDRADATLRLRPGASSQALTRSTS